MVAGDDAVYNYFGVSVSISGDYVIIGDHVYGDNVIYGRGSAYIFKRDGDTWTQQSKLVANDGAQLDYFGISVSVSGDYAIVGAYGDDDEDKGTNSGSAYVFKQLFGVEDLKSAGFTAGELKDAGFTLDELKDAGFTLDELKEPEP